MPVRFEKAIQISGTSTPSRSRQMTCMKGRLPCPDEQTGAVRLPCRDRAAEDRPTIRGRGARRRDAARCAHAPVCRACQGGRREDRRQRRRAAAPVVRHAPAPGVVARACRWFNKATRSTTRSTPWKARRCCWCSTASPTRTTWAPACAVADGAGAHAVIAPRTMRWASTPPWPKGGSGAETMPYFMVTNPRAR